MNDDIEKKQLEIIKHYGIGNQMDLLAEECAELIVAVSKFRRTKFADLEFELSYNLVEEMADVENVIEQIKLLIPGAARLIETIKDNKVNRQLHRIMQKEMSEAGRG